MGIEQLCPAVYLEQRNQRNGNGNHNSECKILGNGVAEFPLHFRHGKSHRTGKNHDKYQGNQRGNQTVFKKGSHIPAGPRVNIVLEMKTFV